MTDTRDAAVSRTDQTLGTVAESNSQMDYAVEVYRDRDREAPPAPDDYEFGQPVYARTRVGATAYALVGVVYDTVLVAPDQGRQTPRLASPDEDVFVPSYVDERRTVLGVAALGYAELTPVDGDGDENAADGDASGDGVGNGTANDTGDTTASDAGDDTPSEFRFAAVDQAMPRWTLDVDDTVRKLSPAGFWQFHAGPEGLRLAYYDRLLATADRFGADVTLSVIDRLRATADSAASGPADADALLDVIERQVRWNAASDRGVVR